MPAKRLSARSASSPIRLKAAALLAALLEAALLEDALLDEALWVAVPLGVAPPLALPVRSASGNSSTWSEPLYS